jgi:hypothetical protein
MTHTSGHKKLPSFLLDWGSHDSCYEEFGLLGCNAQSFPQVSAGFLRDLLFDPEDGGNIFSKMLHYHWTSQPQNPGDHTMSAFKHLQSPICRNLLWTKQCIVRILDIRVRMRLIYSICQSSLIPRFMKVVHRTQIIYITLGKIYKLCETSFIVKSSVFWNIMPCSLEGQSMFQRNMQPLSSRLKITTTVRQILHFLLYYLYFI